MNYSVFDSLLDTVLVLDHERRIVYFNEACTTLLDLPRKRIKPGTPCFDLIKFQASDLYCMPEGTWGENEASPYREVSFTSASGKLGQVQISIQPSTPGIWIVYMRDVTLEQALHIKYRTELKKKEDTLLELQKAHEALADHSKNLEKTVELRTSEIRSINLFLSAILESLGQAFLIFDRSGICQPVYSRACLSLLEQIPAHQAIWDVLKLKESEAISRFQTWIQLLFEERLPFEDLVELAPNVYPHSKGLLIALEFFPMRDHSGKIEGVVLVATDKTREHAAELDAEKERAYVQSIVRIVKSKPQFLAFISETLAIISDLQNRKLDVPSTLRALHTIKGGAGTFAIQNVQHLTHTLEQQWASWAQTHPYTAPPESLFSEFQKLRNEVKCFFEANQEIIGRNLDNLERRIDLSATILMDFYTQLKRLPGNEELSALFLDQFIKLPIYSQFSQVDSIVEELAKAQDKKMKPAVFSGGELRINVDPYRELFSSLIHIYRNCVEHGIEKPNERLEAGKDQAGLLSFSFTLDPVSGDLRIVMIDDGAGINPNRIREKMKVLGKQNLIVDETDEQVIQHIFDPGFSTRDLITELSGRGIGMDAVAAAVKNLAGEIKVESKIGFGTKFTIQVPIYST